MHKCYTIIASKLSAELCDDNVVIVTKKKFQDVCSALNVEYTTSVLSTQILNQDAQNESELIDIINDVRRCDYDVFIDHCKRVDYVGFIYKDRPYPFSRKVACTLLWSVIFDVINILLYAYSIQFVVSYFCQDAVLLSKHFTLNKAASYYLIWLYHFGSSKAPLVSFCYRRMSPGSLLISHVLCLVFALMTFGTAYCLTFFN